MPGRLTNLLVFFLVVALAGSGLLGWLLPEARAQPLFDLHRVLGVALLGLLAWKQLIVRASLRRRLGRRPWDRSVLLGAGTGLALLGSLVLGLAWTLDLVSFNSFGGYSPLNLHVFFGLAILPLLLLHLLRRWERRPAVRQLVTRRSALRLLGLSAMALLGWRVLERAADARASEGSRRPSGSKQAGSFSGNDFPTTIWLFDTVPSLTASTWQLEIKGNLTLPGFVSYDELVSLPTRQVRAVLDCTGGWWSEQVWAGVSVGDLLGTRGVSAAAREATVVSLAGHHWTFPLDELAQALLATHVGGEILSAGHGYPVRLVVPGRRGFQWVKWVGRIEVI